MRKHLLHALGFFISLCCLLIVFSWFFLPKNNRKEDRIYYENAGGILAEPEDSIDVVFLGDSEAFCAFIPLQIWQEHGITSYICSSLDQRLYETEELLHMIFEKQQPKMIILETNVLYRDYPSTETISPAVQQLLPIFRYHDRWKIIQFADFFAPVNYTQRNATKGYRLNVDVKPANTDNYMAYTDDVYPCPQQNIALLKKMHEYCREQGAQLVLLSSPSTLNWSWMMFNYLEPIAEELNVPFLDANQMPDLIPIDWNTDTPDYGDHLNFSGAAKLSRFVGNYLAGTELFTDKRSVDAFSDWNSAADVFFAEAEKMLSDRGNA